MEQVEVVITRQRLSKRVSAARDQHAAIEQLLEAVSSEGSAPRLYNEALNFIHPN
jgi:hypothetical protein